MTGDNISGVAVLIFVDKATKMLTIFEVVTLIIIVGVVIVMLGDITRGVTVVMEVKVAGVEVTATVDSSPLVTTAGASLIPLAELVTGVGVTVTNDSLLVTTADDSLLVSSGLVTDVAES